MEVGNCILFMLIQLVCQEVCFWFLKTFELLVSEHRPEKFIVENMKDLRFLECVIKVGGDRLSHHIVEIYALAIPFKLCNA